MTATMLTEEIITGLEMLQKLTGVGGMPAQEALAALDAGLRTLLDGVKGKVDSTAVLAELTQLSAAIAQDDATADNALAKKFPQ